MLRRRKAFQALRIRMPVGSRHGRGSWPEPGACRGCRGVRSNWRRCTPGWPARRSRPRPARLAVATPLPDDGPAGAEARRADMAGLAPGLAWRAVGLDLDAWPTGDDAPLVLRGVGLGFDDLAHDLATSPELDAKVAARPARGVWVDGDSSHNLSGQLRLTTSTIESGPEGDEPLSHALAALDAHAVWLAVGAVAGHEERLRRFARVFRALPAAPAAERPPSVFGVAVRTYPAGENTYLGLANDTPYPVRLDAVLTGPADAPVFDLGRDLKLKPGTDANGRHLVLDLPPFGVSALRVGAVGVGVSGVTPYPKAEVLTALHARYEDVTASLLVSTGASIATPPARGLPIPGSRPTFPVRPRSVFPPTRCPCRRPPRRLRRDGKSLVAWELGSPLTPRSRMPATHPCALTRRRRRDRSCPTPSPPARLRRS